MLHLDVTLPRSWDTAAAALAACARAQGDARDLPSLMAASGLAFRISLDRALSPAGPHLYPWREVLTACAERLGCRWRMVASREGEPLWEDAREAAFALACDAVEARLPALWFGVHLAEFGLVRGCDRRARVLEVSGLLDGAAPAELPAARIGADTGILFALALTERVPVDAGAAARSALRWAIDHFAGRTPESGASASSGVAAWRLWQDALDAGDVHPLGLAFAAQRYAEARAAVCGWLPEAASLGGLDLDKTIQGYRRSLSMLSELARLFPYPPGPAFMLTSTLREEALELVREAAGAEGEALAALARAMEAADRARVTAGLELRPLDKTTLGDLFTCVEEIPIAGLGDEAARCREALAPGLGSDIDGIVIYDNGAPVGHLLWAPLPRARVPVAAPDGGARWFLYCPWLSSPRRGRGVGAQLLASLVEAARRAGVTSIVTLATSIDVFLHHGFYEKIGFVERQRDGDTRLLEYVVAPEANLAPAQLIPPPPADIAAAGSPLPVVVRHAYHCPLLLRVRKDAARAARALGGAVQLDEADARPGEPAGVLVAGHALPYAPVPPDVLAASLADAARRRR